MAQRRMISKSISVSTKLAKVNPFAALLFTWIIPHCDDGGNIVGDAFTIKGLVMPVRPESVENIQAALNELVKIGLLIPYDVGGQPFLHVSKWEEHQTIRQDRATWRYPKWQPSGNQPASAGMASAAEGKLSKGKGSEEKGDKSFDQFWAAYPKKVDKQTAFKSWKKIPASEHQAIFKALEVFKLSPGWIKDGGQFIPYPATWLNKERWKDEIELPKSAVRGKYEKLS